MLARDFGFYQTSSDLSSIDSSAYDHRGSDPSRPNGRNPYTSNVVQKTSNTMQVIAEERIQNAYQKNNHIIPPYYNNDMYNGIHKNEPDPLHSNRIAPPPSGGDNRKTIWSGKAEFTRPMTHNNMVPLFIRKYK